MNTSDASANAAPLSVRAEAAAWIARLHGADRTEDDERGFRQWLAESELHAAVFERATELWESAARLKGSVLAQHRKPVAPPGHRGLYGWAAAVALTAVAVVGLAHFYNPAISTKLGERRNLTLEDGTRLTLNTSTRVKVRYSRAQRTLELESGEAVFEVARHAGWPFVVTAGDRAVRALGTEFIVRRDGDTVAVTLLAGSVAVEDKQEREVLQPGQRLTSPPGRPSVVDRPALDTVTAWRQGLIALDRTPLNEALAEMNRYSAIKLVAPPGAAPDVQVSGVFRAGESLEFAKALMKSHGFGFRATASGIFLSSPEGG